MYVDDVTRAYAFVATWEATSIDFDFELVSVWLGFCRLLACIHVLPAMTLTQRLKKRNQSDSLIAEAQHDERTTTHDIDAVKDEIDKKSKGAQQKPKASIYLACTVITGHEHGMRSTFYSSRMIDISMPLVASSSRWVSFVSPHVLCE